MMATEKYVDARKDTECLSTRFHSDGYVVLRNALDPATVAGLVAQLSSELRCEPFLQQRSPSVLTTTTSKSDCCTAQKNVNDIQSKFRKYRKSTEIGMARSKMVISGERNVGRIDLQDPSTWPKRGARRVIECVPLGCIQHSKSFEILEHWENIRTNSKLCAALDELLGENNYEIPVNHTEAIQKVDTHSNLLPNGNNTVSKEEDTIKTRHWYCPIVFPEHDISTEIKQMHKNKRQKLESGVTNATIKSIEQGSGRDVQFYSWKSELALFRKFLSKSLRNDEHLDLAAENVEAEFAEKHWQPVNRRRFRGKVCFFTYTANISYRSSINFFDIF